MKTPEGLHRVVLFAMLAVSVYSGTCAGLPTGDCNGDGKVSVVDALLALRVAVGLDQATLQFRQRCDIGPLDTNQVPHPDGQIAIDDALLILRKSLSVPTWTTPAMVTVPSLVGQTQAAAQTLLNASLLAAGTVTIQSSPTVVNGSVINQDPAASALVAPGTAVNIVVSSGPAVSRTVPEITGLTKQAAADTLAGRGYQLGQITSLASPTVTSGNVIDQSPVAGTVASAGASVAITVSSGPPVSTITVPKVAGLVQADAQTAIASAGLVTGSVSRDTNPTIPAGTVIAQYPLPYVKAVSGSPVALVVSSGKATSIPVPPDPTTIAPPLDPTGTTPFVSSTDFIYTGPNPIQTGVPTGTIEFKRAAVLRGKVLDKSNLPLSGVNITVKGHPEFGQTYTRADGAFDLAVNGGGYLTLEYMKEGYLPSQRQVNAPWQDYAWLLDVILIQPDSRVTTVDLTSNTPVQAVQGSQVTDADGTRQATPPCPSRDDCSDDYAGWHFRPPYHA